MIIALHLTNFTIIDELDLEFTSGMTVLTGETGAGKSIIIDAIQLGLGQRLENKVVREGCDKSTISLSFDISNNALAKNWLAEHDLLAEQECMVRRSISSDGKSRAFINDKPVTLQLLAEFGEILINIHGQHQQQALAKKNSQLALLDHYGKHVALLEEITVISQQWHALKKQFDVITLKSQDSKSQGEFLRFQLAEFERLALRDDELEQLDQEHKKLSNAEHILKNCHAVYSIISEQENSLQDQLNFCLNDLEQIKNLDSNLINAHELLNNALLQVNEASYEINRYQQQVDLNPEKLQEIELRLSTIHELARKHRVSAKMLKSIETKLTDDLALLENSDETLQALTKQLEALEKQYQSVAAKLSQQRQKTAGKLATLITKDIQTLNMKGGKFEVVLTPVEDTAPNPFGQERAEFLVAANTGQRLQPLAKVASGGELSRISLAIQVNTAKQMQTPALIFDEVDTGIGGATADIVGQLLQRLGHDTQVFCITHLPQVAAKAQQHFKVEKYVKQKQTFTTVRLLSPEQRIEEIARMSGGVAITQESLQHAKVLLAS